MKRRLRKKTFRGEFKEFGCELTITLKNKEQLLQFMDQFIEQAIEPNECSCGGGGNDGMLELVVELGPGTENPEAKMAKVEAWIKQSADVAEYRRGVLFDLWHGPFPTE